MRKRISIVVVAAGLCAGLLVPQLAAAKATKTVTMVANGPAKGTRISGSWTSPQLGKGTLTGTLKIPVVTITWKASGGTFTTRAGNKGCTSATMDAPNYTGCFRVLSGTGKFKGIKGSGTLKGNLDGHVTYTGKLTY
jgi:hypothetical protein